MCNTVINTQLRCQVQFQVELYQASFRRETRRSFWLYHEIYILQLNTTLAKESEMVLPNVFALSPTDPGSEVQTPVIVIGPKDTTVLAGIQATLECVANARYVYLFNYILFICSFIYSFIYTHTQTQTLISSHTPS